ncbi:MAG: hypothetical protein HQ582_02540, partial [Planctomycetes bacterium]|nr:hypothetical protein [Planctomycetota bacterium]
MNTRPPRCGYAMLLVLVFIALVLSIFGVSYRYMATALRVETARTLQQRRDEGSVHALALGLALLETGLPPSESYACSVEISTSEGPRSFTVTFTLEKEDIWSVYARPTSPIEDLPLMPDSFADPDSPPGRPDKPPRDKPPKPPRDKPPKPP